jgi:RNA polymerase sigma-70 factor, ECF subfamily
VGSLAKVSEQQSLSSILVHSNEQIDNTIETIIKMYDEKLRYFAYRFVRDWELVNDIMQEVYLKVYKHINILLNGSALKSWLYTITANQCRDYLRTNYHRKTILTDEFECITENRSLVEWEVIEKLDKKHLREVVVSLPENYRDPLVLRYFYDYTYGEISEYLNISIECLKSRIHRAKKMVRDKLSPFKTNRTHGGSKSSP